MPNRFEPDSRAAEQAAFVNHVRANLARVGLAAPELARRLGVTTEQLATAEMIASKPERVGLRP